MGPFNYSSFQQPSAKKYKNIERTIRKSKLHPMPVDSNPNFHFKYALKAAHKT